MRYLSGLFILVAACSGIACDGSPVGPTPVPELEVVEPEPVGGFIWNESNDVIELSEDEEDDANVTGTSQNSGADGSEDTDAPGRPGREASDAPGRIKSPVQDDGRVAIQSSPWLIIRPVEEGGQAATQSAPWLIVRAEGPGQ